MTRPIETVTEPHISIGLRYCPTRPITNPINAIAAMTKEPIMSRAGAYPQIERSCSMKANRIKRLKLMRYLSSFIAATDEWSASTRNLRRRSGAGSGNCTQVKWICSPSRKLLRQTGSAIVKHRVLDFKDIGNSCQCQQRILVLYHESI